jgi:hypothetical protein
VPAKAVQRFNQRVGLVEVAGDLHDAELSLVASVHPA